MATLRRAAQHVAACARACCVRPLEEAASSLDNSCLAAGAFSTALIAGGAWRTAARVRAMRCEAEALAAALRALEPGGAGTALHAVDGFVDRLFSPSVVHASELVMHAERVASAAGAGEGEGQQSAKLSPPSRHAPGRPRRPRKSDSADSITPLGSHAIGDDPNCGKQAAARSSAPTGGCCVEASSPPLLPAESGEDEGDAENNCQRLLGIINMDATAATHMLRGGQPEGHRSVTVR